MSHATAQRFQDVHSIKSAQPSAIGGGPCRTGLRLVGSSPALPSLTGREIECLGWCAAGKSYWEAGVILGIRERTVNFHMQAVRSKLGAATNAHAVALAFKSGLLRP